MRLIVGGDSAIGAAAGEHARSKGQEVLSTTRRAERAGPNRPMLDLREVDRWAPPAGTGSACVCAAVSRIGACAEDPAGTAEVNVDGTLALIGTLVERGVHVLFLSTNQVFDGSVPRVAASAPRRPVSEYGRQKAAVEEALDERMRDGAAVAVLRLTKILGPEGEPLSGWGQEMARGRRVRADQDVTMAPVPMQTVAGAIDRLMADRAAGTFQLSGPRDVSYAEAAGMVAERIGADPGLVTPTGLAPADRPRGATPRHTSLDASALRDRYAITVPEPVALIAAILEREE